MNLKQIIESPLRLLCGQDAAFGVRTACRDLLLSEILRKHVIKLFHWDLVVVVLVEPSENSMLFGVGDVNFHWAETVCEFVNVNEFVAIFVESLE